MSSSSYSNINSSSSGNNTPDSAHNLMEARARHMMRQVEILSLKEDATDEEKIEKLINLCKSFTKENIDESSLSGKASYTPREKILSNHPLTHKLTTIRSEKINKRRASEFEVTAASSPARSNNASSSPRTQKKKRKKRTCCGVDKEAREHLLREALLLMLNTGLSSCMAAKRVFGEEKTAKGGTCSNIHITLRRHFKKITEHAVTEIKNLTATEKQDARVKINEYVFPTKGNPNFKTYLEYDEEEFVVILLEEFEQLGVPFNKESLKLFIVTIAECGGHNDVQISDKYIRNFLQRHPHLGFQKSSNIGIQRAKQANIKVRNAVFKKKEQLLNKLVHQGILTEYERKHELDKLTLNFDEMGGGTEGKRAKHIGKRGRKHRTLVVTTGDKQDVFHTTAVIIVRGKRNKLILILVTHPIFFFKIS